jgi:hypothetical protein
MRVFNPVHALVILALAVGIANAQLIVEDFDSQTTGSPPAWLWWNNGSSGTIQVDDTTSRGSSGKSVEIVRTTFDGYGFGFGRNFPPIDGPAELTYYFNVGSTTDEVLTVVGGNNAGHQVAWWIGVGGAVGNAIGTHSHSGGWNHVMNVVADSWYGVTLVVDPTSFTYEITVWEDDNPGNTATETGIPFRDGSDVEVIDQIQFGNFNDAVSGTVASAFVDDVKFIGARVLNDDFESGNTGSWSSSTRPLTAVTSCYQTITTDAYLAKDLTCDAVELEAVVVEFAASNIFFDLNGHTIAHTISDQAVGIGVRAMNVDGVTVKNGTIKDFVSGLDIVYANTATVKDLWIGNLVENDPDNFLPGLRTSESQNVLVRDCFFEFLPVFHKEAIVSAASSLTVDNIEVKTASVGVNLSGAGGSTGLVVNSRFVDVSIGGILIQGTDDARIADNEFARCPINADEHVPGGITGVTIERNLIYNWGTGIHFRGGSSSTIQNNIIRDHVAEGILMDANMLCPQVPTPDCFYATGNLVADNTVTGNRVDLRHHPNALGNTWTNNTCQTKEGAEIPACIPPGP